MLTTIRLASININKLQNKTKQSALGDFLIQSAIDIALTQEVAITNYELPSSYIVYKNPTYSAQGTAVLVRDNIPVSNVEYHPSGRITTVQVENLWICNLYALSGSNQRQQRNEFFATEVATELQGNKQHIICGGDFNCVLLPLDLIHPMRCNSW